MSKAITQQTGSGDGACGRSECLLCLCDEDPGYVCQCFVHHMWEVMVQGVCEQRKRTKNIFLVTADFSFICMQTN